MFKKRVSRVAFARKRDSAPEDPHQKALDETIESSFPASDPPSTIPDPLPDLERTGARKEPPPPRS